MRRPRRRLLIALLATLVSTLVGSTSYALYRTAMGPEQCCKSHCRHRPVSGPAAKRCCDTHPRVLPAAASPEAPGKDTFLAFVARDGAAPFVPPDPCGGLGRTVLIGERPPPDRSLLAQHTSLLR